MRHEIKIQEDFAKAILNGDKTFEVRKNDRGYQKGDEIVFQPIDELGLFSVHIQPFMAKITYVLSGWGITDGYVVFSIAVIEFPKEKKTK